LYDYIGELAQEPEQGETLVSIMHVFRDSLCVAFLWRRLLALASQSPEVFSELLFDLFLARSLQTGNDTIYELGKFLEAAARTLAPERLQLIEQSVTSIPEGEDDPSKLKYLVHCRDRLLARIPKELLVTVQAKQLREEMERAQNVPENEPLVSWSGFTGSEYTAENWLQEQGVDIAAPHNQALLAFKKPLDNFHSKWLNQKPGPDAIGSTMPLAVDAYEALRSAVGADEAVVESLLTDIGEFARTVARAVTGLDDAAFGFCRRVLLACSEHESPQPDPEQKFDHAGWSPAPRIAAAGGLPWLAAHRPDKEMLLAVRTLGDDQVPAVRFLLLTELWRIYPNSPEAFWAVIEGRAETEDNQLVMHALLHSLSYVIAGAQERSVRVLTQVTDRMVPAEAATEVFQEAGGAGLLKEMMPVVTWLALVRRNEWAENVIENLLRCPVRYAESIEELASIALQQYAFPNDGHGKEEVVERAMSLVARAISAASDGIAKLRTLPQDQWNDDLTSRMRATYGVIDDTVRHFYFAFRADEPPSGMHAYNLIKPILEQILLLGSNEEPFVMPAHIAHTFMELLNSVLEYDPVGVLHMANSVVQCSRPAEYYLDSMAIKEVVKLIESILADHRSMVQQGDSLADLLNMLDTFAGAGWSEALRLVWRLDEVFR